MDWYTYTFLLSVILQTSHSMRIKRKTSDSFNVLLNLYKVNPLSQSNVFRAFSNTRLLPSRDQDTAMNADDPVDGFIESIDPVPKVVEIKMIEETTTEVPDELGLEKVISKHVPLPFVERPEEFLIPKDIKIETIETTTAVADSQLLMDQNVTILLPVAKKGDTPENFLPNDMKIVVPVNRNDTKTKLLLMNVEYDNRLNDNRENDVNEVLVI